MLAHEILTARPYAFLDDEELQNRRTNAVSCAGASPSTSASIGALDPDGDRAGARGDRRPSPTTADDLHDLLSSLRARRAAADEWRPLWDELVRARPRPGARARRRRELWCTTERTDDAAPRSPATRRRSRRCCAATSRSSGVTTVDRLAGRDHAVAVRGSTAGLAVLEHEGFALQGRYTGGRRRPSGWRAGCSPACTRTRAAPGASSTGAVTAQDFMRFLLRWQHVAPGTQLAGEAGLARRARAAPGVRGGRGGVGARAARPGACAATGPRGSTGCATTARSAGCASRPRRATTPTRRSAQPSKATPISVVFRADSPWLLDAARGQAPIAGADGRRDRRDPRGAARARARASPPSSETATRRLPEDVERGAVGRRRARAGHVPTASARSAPASTARAPARAPAVLPPAARRARRRVAAARPVVAGPTAVRRRRADADLDRDELAEAVAELLLRRWGVVFRDLAVHDSLRFPWRDLQWALRRLEDRGLVRGGRFVTGFSGEQYALPEAVEQLTHVAQGAPDGASGSR